MRSSARIEAGAPSERLVGSVERPDQLVSIATAASRAATERLLAAGSWSRVSPKIVPTARSRRNVPTVLIEPR